MRPAPFVTPFNLDLYVSVIYVQSLRPEATEAATRPSELGYDKWRFQGISATAENNGARIATVLMCPCGFM